LCFFFSFFPIYYKKKMEALLTAARDRLAVWQFRSIYDKHALLGPELLGTLGTTSTFVTILLPALWALFDPIKRKTWKNKTVSGIFTRLAHRGSYGKSSFAQWMANPQHPPPDPIFEQENFRPTHPLAYLVAAAYCPATEGTLAHGDMLLLFVRVVTNRDPWYAILTLLLCLHYSERTEAVVPHVLASVARRIVPDFLNRTESSASAEKMGRYIFLPDKALRDDIVRAHEGNDFIPAILQETVFPGADLDPFKFIEWDTFLLVLRTAASSKDMALLLRILYPTTLDYIRGSTGVPYKGPGRREVLQALSDPFFYRVLVAREYVGVNDTEAIRERLAVHIQTFMERHELMLPAQRQDILIVLRHLKRPLLEELVLPLILPVCQDKHALTLAAVEARGIGGVLDDALRQTLRDVFQRVDHTPLSGGEMLLLLELAVTVGEAREEQGSYLEDMRHKFLVCMGTGLLAPEMPLDDLPFANVFFTTKVSEHLSLKWLRTQVIHPVAGKHFQGMDRPRQVQWLNRLANVHRGLGEDTDEIQALRM
jgi:hypothetical protein